MTAFSFYTDKFPHELVCRVLIPHEHYGYASVVNDRRPVTEQPTPSVLIAMCANNFDHNPCEFIELSVGADGVWNTTPKKKLSHIYEDELTFVNSYITP